MPKADSKKRGRAQRLKAGTPYEAGKGTAKDDMETRPDLLGLKPGFVKKMNKKAAFLQKLGVIDPATGKPKAASAQGSKKDSPLGEVGLLLDSLSHEPDDATSPEHTGSKAAHAQPAKQKKPAITTVRSNNAKKLVAPAELTRMQQVLQHPSFKANPFATLQEHLKNSMKAAAAAPSTTK